MSKRYNCILFDLDYFKVINDMYGYELGDILLKNIAYKLSAMDRKEDIVTLSAGSYANTGTSIVMVVSLVHGVKLEWERPFQDGSDTHADGG